MNTPPSTIVDANTYEYTIPAPLGIYAQEGNLVFVPNATTPPDNTYIEVSNDTLLRYGVVGDRIFVDSYGSLVDATTHEVVLPYAEAFFEIASSDTSMLVGVGLPDYLPDMSKADLRAQFFLAGGFNPDIADEADPCFGLNGYLDTLSWRQLVSPLSLSPTIVRGGASSTGTVTLDGPAPWGGYDVPLSSSSANAQAPATVNVPQGTTSASFSVSTVSVLTNITAHIATAVNSTTESNDLSVVNGITSLTLRPTTPASETGRR